MGNSIPNEKTTSFWRCIISFMARTLLSPRPLECRSVQPGVTVFQMYLFIRVFQHMFQGLLIVRSHLQTWISRSHDCKKMFQVLQTLTFAWNNSTDAFAMGSSASQHSDVTVRLFESDIRVIERARLRVHSTWVSGNSTRLHADFKPVVILSVTVGLVSKFLLRFPGKSDFCKYNTSCTRNSRTFYDTKRLRNIVYIFMHNLDNPETTVTNCVNAMTHTDVITTHH